MFGSMGGGLDSDEVSRDHGCLPQITAHVFWKFPKRNGANHLIFQPVFTVFPYK